MALNEGQRTLLLNRLAETHRMEMEQLVNLTTEQLRSLWRVLEKAANREQWAAAATGGFAKVAETQQRSAVSIAALLFFQSGDLFKKSGEAPEEFKPNTGNQQEFLENEAKLITQYAMREAGYHISEVLKGNTTPAKAQKQLEGVAQEMLMNSTREFITVSSLKSPAVEAEEEVLPLAERYAPRLELRSAETHYAPEDDVDFDDVIRSGQGETSWLDEDFLQDEDVEGGFEEWTGYKEDETPEKVLTEKKLESYKKEATKPSPVTTNVRSGGCTYCKIVGVGKGPHKWHKNCNCVNLPNFKGFKKAKTQQDKEAENLYYKARAVAELHITDSDSYVTMDDIMREIRIMEAADKNRERVALGEKPRKPHARKPPKTLKEKQDIAMRNAARVQREKDAGRW